MRYVMRIAELVNHQVFERTWHFSEIEEYTCFSVVTPSRPLVPRMGCVQRAVVVEPPSPGAPARPLRGLKRDLNDMRASLARG